jgi:RNA polymerase sigma factor (sigma-70 family)
MARHFSRAPLSQPGNVNPWPFDELSIDFLDGPKETVRTFVCHYNYLLLQYIRCHLLPRIFRLDRHLQPMDVLQEGWKVLIEKLHNGHRFQGEQEFLNFMKTVMRWHTMHFLRDHCYTQKRGLAREESLDRSKHDRPTSEPGPDARLEWEDRWRHILDCCSEEDRPFVQAASDGCTLEEIAQQQGYSLRTAQRKAKKLLEWFDQLSMNRDQ